MKKARKDVICYLRKAVFSQLFPNDQLDLLGALKRPDPAEMVGCFAVVGQHAIGWDFNNPMVHGRELARIIGFKDTLEQVQG